MSSLSESPQFLQIPLMVPGSPLYIDQLEVPRTHREADILQSCKGVPCPIRPEVASGE